MTTPSNDNLFTRGERLEEHLNPKHPQLIYRRPRFGEPKPPPKRITAGQAYVGMFLEGLDLSQFVPAQLQAAEDEINRIFGVETPTSLFDSDTGDEGGK